MISKLFTVALAMVLLLVIPFGADNKPLFEIKEVFRLVMTEEWKMWVILGAATYGVASLVWRD